MFTFADHPHSPFSFKHASRPPSVPNRWEWMPHYVHPSPDLDWYDWVLTRGDPGVLKSYADAFELAYDGQRWRVWKRRSDRSAPVEGAEFVQRLLIEAAPLRPPDGSSCGELGEELEDKSLQDMVAALAERAKSRRGRCGVDGESGRDCELELENHDNEETEFFFRLRFSVSAGKIASESLECSLAG